MLSNHLDLRLPTPTFQSRGAVNSGSQRGRQWRGGSQRVQVVEVSWNLAYEQEILLGEKVDLSDRPRGSSQ